MPRRLLVAVFVAGALAGCGGGSTRSTARSRTGAGHGATSTPTATVAKPRPPALAVAPLRSTGVAWRPVARVLGQDAAWEAQRDGVTLLRFDQRLVRLDLHAGIGEPSGNWRYGPLIEPSEIHHVIAAFNGGFKFTTGDVGWLAGGRVAVPLARGRGSIVTYRDGATDIGAWEEGVPAAGRRVYSVLQNLVLLVRDGVVAANASSCIQACWGATVGNVDVVARSGLGVTADGMLVWGAGAHLVPSELGGALVNAGVVRAVQLDINPDWVAGYLYVHGHSGPEAVPVVPEQLGIAGRFMEPYGRDFFAVVAAAQAQPVGGPPG
ncbi:MAG TPA: hypothetical protein VHT27_02655 [Solirubrobacteraceae bacterium]|jgi:hypothetical protein|nr:hypothetical protein [Solirubrobacteraceae bacterium]